MRKSPISYGRLKCSLQHISMRDAICGWFGAPLQRQTSWRKPRIYLTVSSDAISSWRAGGRPSVTTSATSPSLRGARGPP